MGWVLFQNGGEQGGERGREQGENNELEMARLRWQGGYGKVKVARWRG